MTNLRLYLAMGVPMLFNAVLTGILIAYINSKVDDMQTVLGGKLANLAQRLDDLCDLWRA